MGQAFLYGNGSGGGSGGTLTVTAPAGGTVTISKDGKMKTKTADSSGQAVFKGLKAGTWTVTITDGNQTATQTVEVETDYAVTMTYFSATIVVAFPEGSTCTCSDGNTTLTAPDTSGSYTFVVPNAGTWTVSCTNGTYTATDTVEITDDRQSVSVTLNYNTYLYDNGDSCTSTGGEWTGRGMYIDSSATGSKAPTITKGSTYMKITEASGYGGACYKANKIDLTDVTSIRIKGNVPTAVSREDYMRLQVWSSFGSDSWTGRVAWAAIGSTAGAINKSLNVSTLSGEYYVGIYVFDGASITVYEIELVR